MKITDLLKKQHREVEALFAKIEDSEGEERRMLVTELAANLAAHMRIEEEIVYPAGREADEDIEMEAFEEHTVAAFALKRLANVGLGHETVDAKVKTLKELIKHHVQEEEKELFPKLEKALGRERLEEMAVECQERFEEIRESGYGAELFEARRNGASKRGAQQSQQQSRARS
jgi:hemerythrin superfamily protein